MNCLGGAGGEVGYHTQMLLAWITAQIGLPPLRGKKIREGTTYRGKI